MDLVGFPDLDSGDGDDGCATSSKSRQRNLLKRKKCRRSNAPDPLNEKRGRSKAPDPLNDSDDERSIARVVKMTGPGNKDGPSDVGELGEWINPAWQACREKDVEGWEVCCCV